MEMITIIVECLFAAIFTVTAVLLLLPGRKDGAKGGESTAGEGKKDDIRWDGSPSESPVVQKITYNITINRSLPEEASDAEITESPDLFGSCAPAAESITRDSARLLASLETETDPQKRQAAAQALIECGLFAKADLQMLLNTAVDAPMDREAPEPGPVPPAGPDTDINI